MTQEPQENNTPTRIGNETQKLLTHLWRGGEWANLWTSDGKITHWIMADAIPTELPIGWESKNVYFSVNPATRNNTLRTQNDTVAAVNCLFAEFDAKDYDGGKAAILSHIDSLWDNGNGLPYPSVIIDSGGGFHCYWLLEKTVTIDDGNRDHIKALQAAWVDLVGADRAAKDLARVLRLPGTHNRKPHYAPDFPKVWFAEKNLSRLYPLDLFEEYANLDALGRAAQSATPAASTSDNVITSFNQAHRIVDLLTHAGYTLGWQRGNVARLSRPGKPKNETSVIVFTDINRSYHHSGNDPLHTTGHTRDAFDVWTHLAHNGDTKAAWAAAKQEQGKWENTPVRANATIDELVEMGLVKPEDEEPVEVSPLNVTAKNGLQLGWIDDYADAMTELTGSPREFNQLAGLVTAATALQRKARLRMSFGDIYPNVFGCIIAKSSVYHKSASIHKLRLVMQRAQLDKLLLSELATSEGLLKELQGQSSGVILRDEIGTLFDSHNVKYLRNLKPDLTALFDNFPYSRRLSAGEIRVEKPYLNILGATTPARFYEGISLTDWQDGFLARWLFVMPEGDPDFDAMTGMFASQHEARVQRLADGLGRLSHYEATDFQFVGDAHHLWDTWQRAAAKEAFYFADDVIAAIVTRYSAYALKFAVILSAINDSWGSITPETMQTAIHLADSYKNYAHRLLAEKDEHRVSGAKLQRVFGAILKLGEQATAKRIMQTTGFNKTALTPCIDRLLEVGAIAPNTKSVIGKNGREYQSAVYVAMTKELPIKAWK